MPFFQRRRILPDVRRRWRRWGCRLSSLYRIPRGAGWGVVQLVTRDLRRRAPGRGSRRRKPKKSRSYRRNRPAADSHAVVYGFKTNLRSRSLPKRARMPLRHSSKHAPSGMNHFRVFQVDSAKAFLRSQRIVFRHHDGGPVGTRSNRRDALAFGNVHELGDTRDVYRRNDVDAVSLSRFEKYEPPSPSVAETNTNGMSSTLERKFGEIVVASTHWSLTAMLPPRAPASMTIRFGTRWRFAVRNRAEAPPPE